MKFKPLVGVTLLALIIALAFGEGIVRERVEAMQAGMVEVPLFEVDPFWPKQRHRSGNRLA